MTFALSRRTLLKGALTLPLLEAMFERRVYAAVATAPRRYVFAYCGIPCAGKTVTD